MAVKDGKKRIMITLDEDVLSKLETLYEYEKADNDNLRFQKSDYISDLISNDWKIKKAFGKDKLK